MIASSLPRKVALASNSFADRIDFILSDPQPSSVIWDRAKVLGIPVVTCEYVVQAILNKKLPKMKDFLLPV